MFKRILLRGSSSTKPTFVSKSSLNISTNEIDDQTEEYIDFLSFAISLDTQILCKFLK